MIGFLLTLATLPAQRSTTPELRNELLARVHVENAWPGERREVVRASVPFGLGRVRDLGGLSVAGHATCWLPLTRWPDGSIQWAQAQFVASLPGGKTRSFAIVDEERRVTTPFAAGKNLAAILAKQVLETEVVDPFGVRYRARLRPDPRAGKDGLLVSTPLLRVYRYRDYHRAVDPGQPGIGRDYLSLTAYLWLFSGFEHAELLVILGNDYLGDDEPGDSSDPNLFPLGPVGLERFSLLVHDDRLAFVPRYVRENQLRHPTREGVSGERREGAGTGSWRQDLLGPSPGLYLADATTKAFPFVLFAAEGDAQAAATDADEKLRRQTAEAVATSPLFPLPELDDVRRSRAMNAHGGPAPATPGAARRARELWQRWISRPHFGPFGTWGDIAQSATTGTPRNTTVGMHLALRARSRELVQRAEGFCLQQAIRPYHLWGFEQGADDDLYVEGLPKWANGWVTKETLGRSKIPQQRYAKYRTGIRELASGPYGGMSPFDYEHFTVDVLYDFYCLTGSVFAREELRVLGEQLESVLARKDKYFYSKPWSSRGEGWCMKGLVLCYQATGNEGLKTHAIDRAVRVLDEHRGKPPDSWAVRQAPHGGAFGDGVWWDAPWQQAAYVSGMDAAHRYFGDELFRTIAIDVACYMARQGWVEGVGPKYFVDLDNTENYKLPIGYGPLSGTAQFEQSAFTLAAELATEAGRNEDAALLRSRAEAILEGNRGVEGLDGLAANKWFQIGLDRAYPAAERTPARRRGSRR